MSKYFPNKALDYDKKICSIFVIVVVAVEFFLGGLQHLNLDLLHIIKLNDYTGKNGPVSGLKVYGNLTRFFLNGI